MKKEKCMCNRCELPRIIKGYKCVCKEDNKKVGKDIYSCFKCEKPRKELSRQERLREWISYVFSKAHGMVDDEEKLYADAVKKFNKANP
jgi:hypothetical protein